MSRKILTSEAYQSSKEEVEYIIDHFEESGTMIHSGRNCIKSFQADSGIWNVKRYHKPSAFNRIVYSFFRKPKGKRAFEYPLRVLSAGFETPCPIAYVEEDCMGIIGYTYFISEQCPYTRRFYEFGNARIEDIQDILIAFVHFTAGLHEAGIYHRDYSPGNILFDSVNGAWHFSIVDINRMEFGPVSIRKGCKNFARLWGQPSFFRFIAQEYARARHADEQQCIASVMRARNKFWKPRARHFDLPYELNF